MMKYVCCAVFTMFLLLVGTILALALTTTHLTNNDCTIHCITYTDLLFTPFLIFLPNKMGV